MLSILSNIPPWPGIKSLKSFTPTYRFILDADKSPNCANILNNTAIPEIAMYDISIFPNLLIQYV